MSSPLAIAAVTAVLKDLLSNGVIDHDLTESLAGNVSVSALPPDRIDTGKLEKNQINLFMFQVTQNPGWCNARLPSHGAGGEWLANPLLALDLHYLLTAYGEKEFHAETLLGYAMHLLHERPVLTRQEIRTSLAAPNPPVGTSLLPPGFHTAAAADLADQVEQIKIAPHFLNTEELSKLWTAFQGHYRPSMAYQVSAVLIEGLRPASSPLPVRERKLHVRPFRRPVIDEAQPQIVSAGGGLTLNGQNLQAPGVKVKFGDATADPTVINDQRLGLTLPADLLAGVHTAQVVQELDLGTPDEPHRGFDSNVTAFVLAPHITTTPTLPDDALPVMRGSSLVLAISPPVGRSQQVHLLVGDQAIQLPPRPPTAPATAASVSFPIPGDFPAGTYLMRIQVDGAASPLDVDTNPNSPTVNQYVGPKVRVK